VEPRTAPTTELRERLNEWHRGERGSDTRVPIRCGYCRREIRSLLLTPSAHGSKLVLDSPPVQATSSHDGRAQHIGGRGRRSAQVFDISPAGWGPDWVTARFVCRHKNRDLPTLDRPVRRTTLEELYARARKSTGVIELR
jgi:hypothetical protein